MCPYSCFLAHMKPHEAPHAAADLSPACAHPPHTQGEFLASRGHYAAARRLLARARSHAADCGNREAEAKCLLALARAELAAANPTEAVALVQVRGRAHELS
jgi:hypothetical protein